MNYKTIKRGDPEFNFINGFVIVPRADIEISGLCPVDMKMMIQRAILDGYLKVRVHVPDAEYAWEKLQS